MNQRLIGCWKQENFLIPGKQGCFRNHAAAGIRSNGAMALRFFLGWFLRGGGLATVAICVFGFASFQASAGVLMVYAEVNKQAFDQSGRVILNINSKCTIGIDTNTGATFSRYIHWEDDNHSSQEYWIGLSHQEGIWTIPAIPPAETATAKLKIGGRDGNPEGSKLIPYNPGVKPGSATVSSAVLAHDVQPRWASDEVQSIGLAILDSSLISRALEQGGLLTPWMEGVYKDEACTLTKVIYGASSPDWPERIEFHWDEAAWRQQMAKVGRKDAKTIKSTRSDGALLFELSVSNWLKEGAISIPSEWRTDLNSPRPILPLYHLQSVSFKVTNTAWAEHFPETKIPPGMALRDCRPADQEHRGLTITYATGTTNALISNGSAQYKLLVADALFYDGNTLRQDFGLPALDRKGVQWEAKPVRRRMVIWLLFVPPLLFSLVMWRSKRRQRRLV
jgi:hypothetical protein